MIYDFGISRWNAVEPGPAQIPGRHNTDCGRTWDLFWGTESEDDDSYDFLWGADYEDAKFVGLQGRQWSTARRRPRRGSADWRPRAYPTVQLMRTSMEGEKSDRFAGIHRLGTARRRSNA